MQELISQATSTASMQARPSALEALLVSSTIIALADGTSLTVVRGADRARSEVWNAIQIQICF